MKPFDIALKDLLRSFRSTFALIFMFGIPLLITGMFYLMFGSIGDQDGLDLAATRVVVANLDEGHPQAGQLGEVIVESLQSADFASLMEVTTVSGAAEARQAVDTQQAQVAILIPPGFSASFTEATAGTEIELYTDPTLTLGPRIVESILTQITDHLAGIKITLALALEQAEAGEIEYEQISQIIAAYESARQTRAQAPIETRSPAAGPEKNQMLAMVGFIMGGMMIFFAFFTGVNTANSILQEDEDGTLPRLFTTPTTQAEVLGGKFLAVGLTVLVQVVTLLIAARLFFGIEWGELPAVALAALGIISSAATFGILLCSLLKNSRQGGVIFGAVLTVTGMLGMLDVFTGSPGSTQFGIVPLLVPQGWAARGLILSMNGAPVTQILPYVLTLLAISALFFITGVWRFQKRYA